MEFVYCYAPNKLILALEIENKDAFFPLVEVLFANKEFNWRSTLLFKADEFNELFKYLYKLWIIPIEVIIGHEDTKNTFMLSIIYD
jgi:hypothetical protein